MAIRYGFFDSVNGDRKYSADDISNFYGDLLPDGVRAEPENSLQVLESYGFTVKVLPGRVYINQKWLHNDSDLFLTLDQPDIVLNRTDRIVLRLNREARIMEIAIKRGTPGESPEFPALQRDENIYELSLARIFVRAGTAEITLGDITDERNDTNLCGRIIGFDRIMELQRRIDELQNKLNDSRYYCNGWSDNVSLPEFIASWLPSHPGGTLKIVGNFGITYDAEEVDSITYSMIYENTSGYDITLDFSECSLITAKPWSFACFSGCRVKGLKVRYDQAVIGIENDWYNTAEVNALEGRNVIFEDCHVYGSASGSDTVLIRCYKIENSFMIRCTADFSSENTLWGIMSVGESMISECNISVTGTGENGVYGVSASDCHCSSSKFKAAGHWADGGNSGGDFTGCVFDGIGTVNGYGFRVSVGTLHAVNCTFRGYTRDADNGNGYGLYGANVSEIHLQGIRCPEKNVSGYYQIGSMVFAKGNGFYTGEFYTPPELPAENTILTYTDFMPTKAMTQSEYDSLEFRPENTLYVLKESDGQTEGR